MKKLATEKMKKLIQVYLAKRQSVVANISLVASPDRLLSVLKMHSIQPRTVIDVGVASGTPWLYAGFPNATFHLIDPTRESLPFMKEWAKKLDATVHCVALGDTNEKIEIRNRDTIISSTVLVDLTCPKLTSAYKVDMVRFDSLDIEIKRPSVCKIDVEGAELLVLRGMENRLADIDVFIIETSLNSLYKGGPEFSDINKFLAEFGFRFFDIAGLCRRPFDGALHQIDAVFVQNSSPMCVKRWA